MIILKVKNAEPLKRSVTGVIVVKLVGGCKLHPPMMNRVGPANNWLGSYLTNHSQSVTLNGTTSNEMKIICGVPRDTFLALSCSPFTSMICIKHLTNA